MSEREAVVTPHSREEAKRLAQEARERAEEILVFVRKYRSDPYNYLTTHEALDADQEEGDWFNAVANALLSTLEEIERKDEALRAYEEAIEYVRGCYPEDVFLPESDSLDASSARWARMVCDNIKAEAERLTPTTQQEEEEKSGRLEKGEG